MVINLSEQFSLLNNWIAELRDTTIQRDRMRFRRNLERIGEVAAIEISKHLPSKIEDTHTPLGISKSSVLNEYPVLATILRAGVPLHQGLLNYFDQSDNAFISAYRKHADDGSFEISLDYISCPELENRVLIISDPMLATGASLVKTIQYLKQEGRPREIHIVTAIASEPGIAFIKKNEPAVHIWCGTIDPGLNEKGYIVPGLGDAGDLAFGPKIQF